MLILFFEVCLTGAGIYALITGRIAVFGHWVVEGIGARLIGLLLMMPFTVPFVLGFMKGFEAAQQGKQVSLDELNDLGLLEIGLWVGCFALAGLIALVTARNPAKVADPEEEWKRIRAGGQMETTNYNREENPLRRR